MQNGWTALFFAVLWDHADVVKLLVDFGAVVDLRDKVDLPVHSMNTLEDRDNYTQQRSQQDKIKVICYSTSCVFVIIQADKTGLMYTSLNGDTDTLKVLLEAGADPNITNEVKLH